MGYKVLAIDDEVGFTRLLKMNLEKGGEYEVCIENDSNQALDTALEFHPDVVLLDIVMPGMDGGDVSAQFQANESLKGVPIIMMTALMAPTEIGDDGFGISGTDIVLPKPVKLEVLKQCIEEAIKRANASPTP